jgi:hypothetical protein
MWGCGRRRWVFEVEVEVGVEVGVEVEDGRGCAALNENEDGRGCAALNENEDGRGCAARNENVRRWARRRFPDCTNKGRAD